RARTSNPVRSAPPCGTSVRNDQISTTTESRSVAIAASFRRFRSLYHLDVSGKRAARWTIVVGAFCVAVAATAVSAPGTLQSKRYVALGDSFSSGDGNPPYRPGTDRLLFPHDKCHRSYFAYSSIVHSRRGGSWAFWACSGARIPDMTSTNRENPVEGAQLDR